MSFTSCTSYKMSSVVPSRRGTLCVRIIRSGGSSGAVPAWEVLDSREAYVMDSTVATADDLGVDTATLEEYMAVTASSAVTVTAKERRRLLEAVLNRAVQKFGGVGGK